MRATATTEIEYLIGSVFMEALKYLYATNVKHYTSKKHRFYKDIACKHIYTFEDAINDIYSDYGITQGLSASKIVKHRNEVIHEGKFTSPFPDVLDTLLALETTMEHLLLKMLDYDGPYKDRRGRKTKRFDSFKSVIV